MGGRGVFFYSPVIASLANGWAEVRQSETMDNNFRNKKKRFVAELYSLIVVSCRVVYYLFYLLMLHTRFLLILFSFLAFRGCIMFKL